MKEEGKGGPAPAPESSKHGERQTRGAEGVEFEMSTARRIETPNALKGSTMECTDTGRHVHSRTCYNVAAECTCGGRYTRVAKTRTDCRLRRLSVSATIELLAFAQKRATCCVD